MFSIELASEKIVDSRTRNYFNEIVSAYINDNHRSAVVMLWSVVICDLVYKLKHLQDVYNDQIAISILKSIQDKRAHNPKSSEWEFQLIEEIKNRTQLLDNATYEALIHLQKIRHLSAHPVLSDEDLLFSPNKETVRALIRNTMEGVLLKPPILTKKVISELVKDLANHKDLLIDDNSLERYIQAKYLRNLRPEVLQSIFRALWKFVFQLSNNDTDENREINYRAIRIIYLRNQEYLLKVIADHSVFFSDAGEGEHLDYLVRFLSDFPPVYSKLTTQIRVLIDRFIDSDIEKLVYAVFRSESFSEHIAQVIESIKRQDSVDVENRKNNSSAVARWKKFIQMAEEEGIQDEICDLAINLYIRSARFNTADSVFDIYMGPIIPLLNQQHIPLLLQGIENNGQTYRRSQSKADHLLLKRRIEELHESFDFEKYPNFCYSLPAEKNFEDDWEF